MWTWQCTFHTITSQWWPWKPQVNMTLPRCSGLMCLEPGGPMNSELLFARRSITSWNSSWRGPSSFCCPSVISKFHWGQCCRRKWRSHDSLANAVPDVGTTNVELSLSSVERPQRHQHFPSSCIRPFRSTINTEWNNTVSGPRWLRNVLVTQVIETGVCTSHMTYIQKIL